MNIKEFQIKVKEHGEKFKHKGETNNHQLPNYVSFPYFKAVEELGEVADVLVRRFGFQRKGKELSPEEFKTHLGEEIVDVLVCLTHIANFCDIDLESAAALKFAEMDRRWNNQEY